MQSEKEEILDLVDINDTIIGTVLRGDMTAVNYNHPKGYVRFVNAFLINKEHKIWSPTRAMRKFIAPGGKDYSVAEHVLAGETYDDAVIRGFVEEANLHVTAGNLELLGMMPPTKEKPVFDAVFALYDYDDNNPDYSKEEFSSSEWLTLDELQKILTAHPSKASLLPALQLLREHKR